MIHDKLPVEHFITHSYRCRCSCGWAQAGHTTQESADERLQAHIDTHIPKDEQPTITFS